MANKRSAQVKMVTCWGCNRTIEDKGPWKTCPHCGCSPMPSYDLPEDSNWHATHMERRRKEVAEAYEAKYGPPLGQVISNRLKRNRTKE